MYQSIVVGTDGSESAQAAVSSAAELALLAGARLTVVTAYRSVRALALMAAGGSAAIDLVDAEDQQRMEAEELLTHAVMRVDAGGVRITTEARAGDPAEVLISTAEEVGADLIVVGNRGMGGVARFLLGSVPNRVAHHAPCAVLIAHTS
ncbi:MAG: hypothetical protein QOJ92_1757 [Frankiales bacterium]|jgi:nucleotide-binding universal stress UspA family protein|nr:hypothetical protein [Frankiales bacterium]MDX6274547.1 hypothetical protein [Frankiales bacterium]